MLPKLSFFPFIFSRSPLISSGNLPRFPKVPSLFTSMVITFPPQEYTEASKMLTARICNLASFLSIKEI